VLNVTACALVERNAEFYGESIVTKR